MFSLSSMVFVGSGPVFTSRFTRCSCISSFNRLNPRFEATFLSLSNTKPPLAPEALLRAASKIEAKKKDDAQKELSVEFSNEKPTEEKEITDEVVKLTNESPEELPVEEATATDAKGNFNFHAKKIIGKQKDALKDLNRIAGEAERGGRINYKIQKEDQKLDADKMEIADALLQEEKTDQSTAEKPSKEN